MSIAASEGERMSSGDEHSAALPPSGVAALPESDPEMAAMLSRAAASVRLEWNPPPCPEPSRLDDWFLGVARAGSQRSAPVPFFPEVHEEVTKSWTAPFSARSRSGPSSSLTTLDGGAAKGYVTTYSDGPRPTGDESHCTLPGSGDVHLSGPGAPPVAEPGRYA